MSASTSTPAKAAVGRTDSGTDHSEGVIPLQSDIIKSRGARIALAVSRLLIGFTFLWPFFDKTFGLGFGTKPERAWINGGNPAQGFIGNVEGPFAPFIKLFANPFGDVLFMVALLAIGVAVMSGAGLKIAAVAGSVLLGMMYLAEFPPVLGGTNPLFDSHWLEALMLITAAATLSGDTWGVGKLWGKIIGRHQWLR